MRIHVLINCYWGSGMSGGDRRTLELVRRWILENEVIVYTTENFAKIMQREEIFPKQVFITDKKVRANSGLISAYFKRTVECIKLMKRNIMSGDIIYSPTDILPDVLPAFFCRDKSASWSLVTHHIYEKFYKRPGSIVSNFISCTQQKMAIHIALKYVDNIITPSPIVFDYMLPKRKKGKLYLSGNGVDFGLIDEAEPSDKVYESVILCRLNYSKGIFELPQIWKKVVQEVPQARLAIMGAGAEEIVSELKKSFEENGILDNVDVMGYVDSLKGFSIIKSAKSFVFTSHEEGWGIAIAEALACGTPVVAYDLPVYKRVFPEGMVRCEFKNTDKMAMSILNLLRNKDRRDMMAKSGCRYVRDHYSLDALAKNELSIIGE